MEKYDWAIWLVGSIVSCAVAAIVIARMVVAFRYWRSRLFYKMRLISTEEIDLSAIEQPYKLYYGRIRVTQIPFTQDKNDYSVRADLEVNYTDGAVVRWYGRAESPYYQHNYELNPKSRVYDKENTDTRWDSIAIIYTPKPVSEEYMSQIAGMDCFSSGQVTFLSGPQWFCKAKIYIYGILWDKDIRDLLYIDCYNVNEGSGVRTKMTMSDKRAQYSEEEETNNN